MRILFAPCTVLLASSLGSLLPTVILARPQENAKIAIHVKAATTKFGTVCGSWAPATPCSQYNTGGRVGVEQYVYLVVGNASMAGLTSAEFGMDYDPTEGVSLDVHAWTLCASTMLSSTGVHGEWPSAGSGLMAFWNCQSNWIEPNGVHALIGVLSVYAYSADTLKITGNPIDMGDPCVRK